MMALYLKHHLNNLSHKNNLLAPLNYADIYGNRNLFTSSEEHFPAMPQPYDRKRKRKWSSGVEFKNKTILTFKILINMVLLLH